MAPNGAPKLVMSTPVASPGHVAALVARGHHERWIFPGPCVHNQHEWGSQIGHVDSVDICYWKTWENIEKYGGEYGEIWGAGRWGLETAQLSFSDLWVESSKTHLYRVSWGMEAADKQLPWTGMEHQSSRHEVVRKKRPKDAKHRGFATDGVAKRRGLHHSQSVNL